MLGLYSTGFIEAMEVLRLEGKHSWTVTLEVGRMNMRNTEMSVRRLPSYSTQEWSKAEPQSEFRWKKADITPYMNKSEIRKQLSVIYRLERKINPLLPSPFLQAQKQNQCLEIARIMSHVFKYEESCAVEYSFLRGWKYLMSGGFPFDTARHTCSHNIDCLNMTSGAHRFCFFFFTFYLKHWFKLK